MKIQTYQHNPKHFVFCISLVNIIIASFMYLFFLKGHLALFSIETVCILILYFIFLYWTFITCMKGLIICKLSNDGVLYSFLTKKFKRDYYLIPWHKIEKIDDVYQAGGSGGYRTGMSFIRMHTLISDKVPKPTYGNTKVLDNGYKLLTLYPRLTSESNDQWVTLFQSLHNKYKLLNKA